MMTVNNSVFISCETSIINLRNENGWICHYIFNFDLKSRKSNIITEKKRPAKLVF